ncbi:hypothetical protein B4U79_16946 [Dinothrombium tinctorium]|uniref:glucan endo-1,3-beta-D-glucosidase n=1 Tax=Dinothrombium tinctorium TaxID=1965070 RepID=A0A443QAC5_9ACAR|nr:hypothetical protein B4U79_16946 [Dinothrombium tinctorium]
MGTTANNRHCEWNRADSNCLISTAAAELNACHGPSITVSQGVSQQSNEELLNIEIDRAFIAAEYANGVFPETVESIILTVDNLISQSRHLLDKIQRMKHRAHHLGLKIGIRTYLDAHNLSKKSTYFFDLYYLINNCDIIMCNIYPDPIFAQGGTENAVSKVIGVYWSLKERLTAINPTIQVVIGETGWASSGIMRGGVQTSTLKLVDYWKRIGKWASEFQIPLYFFEAIDQPWKADFVVASAHFGWWTRDDTNFREKIVSLLKSS